MAEGARPLVGVVGSAAGVDRLKARSQKKAAVETVKTPYGSVDVVKGEFNGGAFAAVAKAIASPTPPHRMPHRATLFALKKVGCLRVLSTSVVTSVDERLRVGDIFVPDDFIDTTGWSLTFFDGGLDGVHNAEMEAPFCRGTSREFVSLARSFGLRVLENGTVANVAGPQHPTVAEAARLAQAGAMAVSFSAAAEAKLARELGLCFVSAAVTARAAVPGGPWRAGPEPEEEGEVTERELLRAFAEGRDAPVRGKASKAPAPHRGARARGSTAHREAEASRAHLKDIDARFEDAVAGFVPHGAAMAPCRYCPRGAGPVGL